MSGTAGKTPIALTQATRERLRTVQRRLTMKYGRAVTTEEAVSHLLTWDEESQQAAVSRETQDTP
jgi:hypothetical protein